MDAERSADGVFGLLSNEIRVDILRAIAIAQHEAEKRGSGMAELSFSDVYERVDVDNTSKLSYHLGELTGTFLRKDENGYSFTHAGERMVRFVLAENYRRPADSGTVEAEGTCLFCGAATLEAALSEQYFVVGCTTCDRPATGYIVTPAQARSYEGADLLESFKRKQAAEYGMVHQGLCPACGGRIHTEVVSASEVRLSDSVPISFLAIDECRQCLRVYSGPLTYSAAYHPASVAFHWDHGVDITGTGIWELHHHLYEGRWSSERLGANPDEYRVVLRRDDEALRVFLDGNTRVTRTERVRGRTVGFAAVAFWEELVFRGVFLTNGIEGLLERGHARSIAVPAALFGSAVVFALVHVPGALSEGYSPWLTALMIFSMGLLFGIAYLLTGELALPMGLHLAINFVSGNVFGIEGISTMEGVPTLFAFETAESGLAAPMSGVPILVSLAVGCALVVGWCYRRRGLSNPLSFGPEAESDGRGPPR